MEKKIEISKPMHNVGLTYNGKDWICHVLFNNDPVSMSYGFTPEEAESNARIAAKGYLVEELVECLQEFVETSPCQNGCSEDDMTCLTSKSKYLLTKAKTV